MKRFKKVVSLSISLCFIVNTLLSNYCFAAVTPLNLPAAGKLLPLSAPSAYTVLRGMRINPKDPLKFEFVIDKPANKAVDKEEFRRLVSYFMAALTIPEKDFWVNLSPYEKNRIIPAAVADTDFGRDLLTQDYVLKQVSASLTYPESELGKQYWQKVYDAAAKAGIKHDQAVNAFSKVWIVPENVEVFEDGNLALVGEARLKVLSQADYNALSHNSKNTTVSSNDASAKILREMLIPALTKEVNTGANFTQLRQMFHSFALALWFKGKLKDSFFKYYINQNKTKGIDLSDKTIKDKVYNQYVDAFKQGVYNMIKKERATIPSGDNSTKASSRAFALTRPSFIKRQYFSGGVQVYAPGAFTVLALKNADGVFNHDLPSELLAKLQVKEIAGDDRVMEAYFLDIIAHWQHMGWDVNKLTPGLLKELYRAHILPVDLNDPVGRNTRKLLISVRALTADNNYRSHEAQAIAENLASEPVHLLGVRRALILGLVALSCSNPVRSNGDASDASTIIAPAVIPEDAGVVPTSDVIPSQGGQADTANPVGGTLGTGGAVGTGGVTGAGGSLAAGGATGTVGTPEDAGIVPTSDVIPSQGGQADTANPVGGTLGTGGAVGTGGVTGAGGSLAAGGATGTGGATTVSSKPTTIPLNYGNGTQGGFAVKNFGSAYANPDPQNPNSISIRANLQSASDWGNAVIEFSPPQDLSGYTLQVTVASTNGMQGLYVYNIPVGADPNQISKYRNASTITGFKAGAVYEIPLNNATNTQRIVFETSASPNYGTGNPVGSSSVVITLELVPNDVGTSKQAGSDWWEFTPEYRQHVLNLAKESVRDDEMKNDFGRPIIVYDKYMPDNVRGANVNTKVDGSGRAVIALRKGMLPRDEQAVLAHENKEIDLKRTRYEREAIVKLVTADFSFSHIVHILASAQERAEWISQGHKELMPLDDSDLSGYPAATAAKLAREKRDRYEGIVDAYFGHDSDIAKNYRAYEKLFREKAAIYGGVSVDGSGSAKKSGTPYAEVTQAEKDAALIGKKVSDVRINRSVTGVVVRSKMSPDRRGFHMGDGYNKVRIAVNENMTSSEIAAYVEQHEIREIKLELSLEIGKLNQIEINHKDKGTPSTLFRERVVHMVVAAAERAQWIKDGKEGLMPVDAEDLKSYDKPALDGLSAEDRSLQQAIIEEFYGKGSEIAVNSAEYETRYRQAAVNGGVDLANTKIIKHVLGAPVNVEVSPKVVEEFKNAKSVGFEILSVGGEFVLR